jgi:hypothetical protein
MSAGRIPEIAGPNRQNAIRKWFKNGSDIDAPLFPANAGDMHSAEEQTVLDYLATSPGSFFSAREVCRRAGSKQLWEENPRWAVPILTRLAGLGLVKDDGAGHYGVVPRADD